ncbi:RNA 2',3'-cyclic phosphodiesterase [Streptomyces niveiscabiei]|uniref:RNA 2',3'-cyclic phosphodiesterase n=1 Tax=Streptomyces niveiscabiei TaxID=164115 RepID=UPI0029BC5D40|nr:RNA 2',3'-cyclic phosphodiesterase [Streptomyces niveiscabiei]MDX3385141.1 RNA 2',3'-cyclic phosphodiesterase [Streptomyces niveiscabiei]
MRLFAAVLPPDRVRAELDAVVGELRTLPGADALRWTGREGWHFTLAFYGDVDDDAVPELSARLERAAGRTEPFELAVRGGGQFGQGRVVWAGAAGEVAALRLLADRAEAAGRRAGVEMEHRRYKPHLTLARGREGVAPEAYVGALGRFSGRGWRVGELALMRSELPRSGVAGERPRYEVVGRWGLGGGG